MLQSPDHLGGPVLDLLQCVLVCLVLGAQNMTQSSRRGLTNTGIICPILLATVLPVQPRAFVWSGTHCWCTHTHVGSCSLGPQDFFCKANLHVAGFDQFVLLHGLVPSQPWDFSFDFVLLPEVSLSSFSSLVQQCCSEFGVTWRLAENTK